MERYWQWIKGQLFVSRSNKVFNKVNRINSLWLFWCIYFSYTKYYCYKNYAVPDSSPAGTKPENNNNNKKNKYLLQLHKLHLKILHHLRVVEQKSLIFSLIIQILLKLQCLCTIWLNIVTTSLLLQEVCW